MTGTDLTESMIIKYFRKRRSLSYDNRLWIIHHDDGMIDYDTISKTLVIVWYRNCNNRRDKPLSSRSRLWIRSVMNAVQRCIILCWRHWHCRNLNWLTADSYPATCSHVHSCLQNDGPSVHSYLHLPRLAVTNALCTTMYRRSLLLRAAVPQHHNVRCDIRNMYCLSQ